MLSVFWRKLCFMDVIHPTKHPISDIKKSQCRYLFVSAFPTLPIAFPEQSPITCRLSPFPKPCFCLGNFYWLLESKLMFMSSTEAFLASLGETVGHYTLLPRMPYIRWELPILSTMF